MNISRDKQKCCVRECLSTRKERFHQFPKLKSLGLLWLKATNNSDLINLTYEEVLKCRYVICRLHFRSEDYICGVRKKLKEGSVPSVNLPDLIEGNESPLMKPSECIEENIDCDEISTKEISCKVPNLEFSPVKVGKPNSDSENSPTCRRSSLTFSNESSHCFLTSTPNSRSERSGGRTIVNRPAVLQGEENPIQQFGSTIVIGEKEIGNGVSHSIQQFDETGIVKEGNANQVPDPSTCTNEEDKIMENENAIDRSSNETNDPTPGTSLDTGEKKSSDYSNSPAKSSEKEQNSFQSRGSKRLIWRARDLDEKTRKIYQQVLTVRKERDNSKLKCIRYENRMRKINENANSKRFYEEMEKLSSLQRQFVEMILRNSPKEKHGRRFTTDERLLCLSIYKRSACAYKYLCTFLPLPTPRRVRQLLTKIRLDCGITETVKNCLKEASNRMQDPQEKACIIMWDEVSLKLHTDYCSNKDKIVGLEDWGNNRTSKYADHALVFMLRGVKSGWKMPLTYNFCNAQTTHGQLEYCIKEVIREVSAANFTVVATVCDQGSSNMKAIKQLQLDSNKIRQERGEKEGWTILIDDNEIVPLYDIPHILKCMRNNFLTKNIEFDYRGKNVKEDSRKIGSWDHIITAYEIDVYSFLLDRHIPNVTELHVYPEKIKKMKVKLMMQVFSKKMYQFIDILARTGGKIETSIGERSMPAEGVHTAFIVRLMNGIADAMNGVSSGDDHPKRIPWSETSYHQQFLKDAVRQLKDMRFVDPKTHKEVKTDIPCLKNLIDTLEGFQLLWAKLKSLGFTSFDTRNINQDPLENFFGTVKSHDFRSNKPTSYQFEAIFKSLLITNLTSKNSPGYNCEEDGGFFILSDSNTLLAGSEYLPDENDDEEYVEDEHDFIEENTVYEKNQNDTLPEKNVAPCNSSDVLKIIQTQLPSIKSCSECIKSFTQQSSLEKGSSRFQFFHSSCKTILGRSFKRRVDFKNIRKKCVKKLQRSVNTSFFTCKEHRKSVFPSIFQIIVEKYLSSITTFINRILCGRIVPKFNNCLSYPFQNAHKCFLKTVRQDRRLREGLLPSDVEQSTKSDKNKICKNKVDDKSAVPSVDDTPVTIKQSKKNAKLNIKLEANNAIPLGKKQKLNNQKTNVRPKFRKPLTDKIEAKNTRILTTQIPKSKQILEANNSIEATELVPLGKKSKSNENITDVEPNFRKPLQNLNIKSNLESQLTDIIKAKCTRFSTTQIRNSKQILEVNNNIKVTELVPLGKKSKSNENITDVEPNFRKPLQNLNIKSNLESQLTDIIKAKSTRFSTTQIRNSKQILEVDNNIKVTELVPLGRKRNSNENIIHLEPKIRKPLQNLNINSNLEPKLTDKIKTKNTRILNTQIRNSKQILQPNNNIKATKLIPSGSKRKSNKPIIDVELELKKKLNNCTFHVEEIESFDDSTSKSIQLHITEDSNLESQFSEMELLLANIS